ncbi:MAG: hypothetical protein IPJ86_10475 [Bacteroidetes bacterium]|nr:hypothetical protein [Bacteroidota bacterium]
MKRTIYYWLLRFFTISAILMSNVLVNAQGYRYDKNKTQKILHDPINSMGFVGKLPASYSLRKWAPTPSAQEGNSCVGWALAYAAMSITYNQAFNITNKFMKDMVAFDPVFTYALAKTESTNSCDEGVFFPIALEQMLKYGCKRIIMPPISLDCNESVFDHNDAYSAPFVPNEIYAVDLDKVNSIPEKIKVIKSFLANGVPLPFGMETTRSMMGNGKGNPLVGGLWKPSTDEEMMGGHAMCLIGFSDTRFGGAFEVMNSWGTGYGEKGFFWIKYADFINRVYELIFIEPITVRSDNCKIGDCATDYSYIKRSDGSSYEGMMDAGKPEGYGIYSWVDNSFYAGIWKDGKRHGAGLLFHNEKIFKCLYSMNDLIEAEPIGFSKDSRNDETEKVIHYLEIRKMQVEKIIPKEISILLEEQMPPEEWK